MKKLKINTMTRVLTLIAFFLVCTATSQAQEVEKYKEDKEQIKNVIKFAYIEGIHNLGDIGDIQEGFHPGFELLIKGQNEQLVKFPIYSWIERVESNKRKNPEGPDKETTVEFRQIDVTGDAAMAKIDLYKDGKKIFTDYLLLYKFFDDWRIVSKVYEAF